MRIRSCFFAVENVECDGDSRFIEEVCSVSSRLSPFPLSPFSLLLYADQSKLAIRISRRCFVRNYSMSGNVTYFHWNFESRSNNTKCYELIRYVQNEMALVYGGVYLLVCYQHAFYLS